MSTSISTAFIKAYDTEVKQVFQREGSYLRDTVQKKTGVVGSTAVFQKVGTGSATTKARNGMIVPMNQTHTAPSVTLVDFYAADYVDRLDEVKTNINERDVIARGGAMALGRKLDSQITTVLDTTSQSTVTLTTTNKGTVLATALEFTEALWSNDVPNRGDVYAAVTSRFWSQLSTLDQFGHADYVRADGQVFVSGPDVGRNKFKDWLGAKWTMFTGLPGEGTATAKNFIWHRNAVGYASAADARNIAGSGEVAADINFVAERDAYLITHVMSGNAVMIDDTGVIEGDVDDTAAIVTS